MSDLLTSPRPMRGRQSESVEPNSAGKEQQLVLPAAPTKDQNLERASAPETRKFEKFLREDALIGTHVAMLSGAIAAVLSTTKESDSATTIQSERRQLGLKAEATQELIDAYNSNWRTRAAANGTFDVRTWLDPTIVTPMKAAQDELKRTRNAIELLERP